MVSDKTQVRWEYLIVEAYEGTVQTINEEAPRKVYPQCDRWSVAEFANWVGEQGWELVSCSGGRTYFSSLLLVFKYRKVR